MKAGTSETRLLKNGRVNSAFIDRPVPLVYKGSKVGSVATDGTVEYVGRSGGWFEYVQAGEVERELKMNGAHKVLVNGSATAVVVRNRR